MQIEQLKPHPKTLQVQGISLFAHDAYFLCANFDVHKNQSGEKCAKLTKLLQSGERTVCS